MAKPYVPTYLPDGCKAYNPQRTERDIHDEWRAFEDVVRSWGIADPLSLHMLSRELWRQEEQDAEPWKGWQKRVWYPRMAALAAGRKSIELTTDEWAALEEHFAGANDPIFQSILRKAQAHSKDII